MAKRMNYFHKTLIFLMLSLIYDYAAAMNSNVDLKESFHAPAPSALNAARFLILLEKYMQTEDVCKTSTIEFISTKKYINRMRKRLKVQSLFARKIQVLDLADGIIHIPKEALRPPYGQRLGDLRQTRYRPCTQKHKYLFHFLVKFVNPSGPDFCYSIDVTRAQKLTILRLKLLKKLFGKKRHFYSMTPLACLNNATKNWLHSLVQSLSDENLERVLSSLLACVDSLSAKYANLKINLDMRNSKGETPLILAVRHGWIKKVVVLLSYQAEVDAEDATGRNALWYAFNAHNKAMILILLKARANLNQLYTNDQTYAQAIENIVPGYLKNRI